MVADRVADILGESGPFAELLPGYRPRASQLAMAEAVETALAEQQVLLVEAATGTGKTFAYLAPALLAGKRVIVSTGTRNLQDQLYQKDLPLVRKAVGDNPKTALLKGRANYLCPYRLELHLQDGRLPSRQIAADLQTVARWAGTSRSGDIAEVIDVAEDSGVWPFVTSTADNCLGQECPQIENCPLAKARKAAQQADLVVVNHHLFFADVALKDEGFGELLPDAGAVIFDEAHQLPEVASMFFGESISARQLTELAHDAMGETMASAGDMNAILACADRVEKAVNDMRLAFGEEVRKGTWDEVATLPAMPPAITAVQLALAELKDWLEAASVRSKGLEACFERAKTLAESFEQLTGDTPENQVHWFETYKRGFVIQWTPLDVAKPFRNLLQSRKTAWVFTSATLAVHDDFTHFRRQLGLPETAQELVLASPFDYERQALFCVPRGLPDPSDRQHTQAVLTVAEALLPSSRGRAFLLFTSHRALKAAAEYLADRLPFPLLVQGTSPKAELLRRFRELGNAVLLGTGSFWEGVDVRGEALSLVIIDKLPFASPGDPVVAARIDAYKARGGNPFFTFQLPAAIIALKQGAGRLIRDVDDEGVLVVCDNRLTGRPYGKLFLQSLPPMRRTRGLDEVAAFFHRLDQDREADCD